MLESRLNFGTIYFALGDSFAGTRPRKKIKNDEQFILIYNDWKQSKMTAMEATEKIGMESDTFFKRVKIRIN